MSMNRTRATPGSIGTEFPVHDSRRNRRSTAGSTRERRKYKTEEQSRAPAPRRRSAPGQGGANQVHSAASKSAPCASLA